MSTIAYLILSALFSLKISVSLSRLLCKESCVEACEELITSFLLFCNFGIFVNEIMLETEAVSCFFNISCYQYKM